jgi:hypothetical protein
MEVSDQLANLGAMIAGGIEKNVQQTQFNNALPGIQQAFQSAMTDFDAGRSGAGFSKIMAVAMENPNNPMIQNISQMAFKAGQFASDDYFKSQQINVMKSRYGGSGEAQVTADDIISGLNAENGITPDTTGEGMVDQGVAESMSAGARGLPIRQSILANQQRIQQQKIQQPTLTPYQGTPQQQSMQAQEDQLAAQGDLKTPVEVPLPGEEVATSLAFKQEKPQEQPSPLEMRFQKKFEDWSSMPLDQQKVQDEATSISFGNEKDLTTHVSKLPKGQKFVPADPSLQSVLPGVTGFILPEKFSQWTKKGVTIGKSISQTIGKEEKLGDESKKSAEWFDAFRDAAVSVDSNPRLRNLLKEAGGVASIEYQPVDRAASDQEIDEGLADSRGRVKTYQAAIRGSNIPPIEITKDEVQDLETLKTKTAAMQTMGAKAVINRSSIKKQESKLEAPAQPTPNKIKVEVFTDAKGRYYLNKQGQKVYK